ncbi:hypothetical protein BV898_15890 [Hypsibius exemplaris]|uniref:Gustatory receptor n=1 Tax=Hypsibius exemplaris TaxID=2072580 RepID=A0A9X6NC52_HYPEX|nr:hypothetical protein BV898_15890 [Hypsibius exemplaris]
MIINRTEKEKSQTPRDKLNVERVLTGSLIFFGLLPSQSGTGCSRRWQMMRAAFWISLAAVSVIFEFMSKINTLIQTPNRDIEVLYLVQYSQYWIKTIAVVLILTIFYRKSSKIVSLMDQLNVPESHHADDDKVHRREGLKEYHRTGCLLMALAIIICTMTTMRVLDLISLASDATASAKLFGMEVNLFGVEVVKYFTRDCTEPIRLLCSGYIGLLLCRFSTGLAVESRKLLQQHASNNRACSLGVLTRTDICSAWKAREAALTMSRTIQEECGLLLLVILLADVLCLNASFANFLSLIMPHVQPEVQYHAKDLIRNCAQIILYSMSAYTLTFWLIRLDDIDKSTQEIVKILQSTNCHHIMSKTTPRLTIGGLESYGSSSKDAQGHEKLQEKDDLAMPLFMLDSSCFQTRAVAPCIAGCGPVTRVTVFSVLGILVTFFCFMMDQVGRGQEKNDRSILPSYNSSCST